MSMSARRAYFGEVDPVRCQKMRRNKKESCFHASGTGSTPSDREAGFTLLEFLVAFALLTLFLGAALAGVAVAVRGDRQANFLTQATMLAQTKLASAGVEYPLGSGRTGGELSNGYVWQADMRRYGPVRSRGSPAEGYWVEVTVADPRSNGSRAVSLATVVLVPGAAP
jgi:general secretion pathway protein I